MKSSNGLLLAAAAAAGAEASRSVRARSGFGTNAFIQNIFEYRGSNASSGLLGRAGEVSYGKGYCQCVGIDNLEGTTAIEYEGAKFTYPADVGAHCSAWEQDSHPDCKGDKAPDWCSQSWCYVDPCSCDMPAGSPPPKPSAYMAHAQFQGKPVHFSYATCGGSDSWSSDEAKKNAKYIEGDTYKKLCGPKQDAHQWGDEKCQCIGIDGQEGSTEISYNGDHLSFPADVGATCEAWDKDVHPDCKSDKAPDWCSQRWCYVDPCSCDIDVPSKHSAYAPDASYQGKPVHFSYATCGGTDSFSSAEMKAQAKDNKKICSKHEPATGGHAKSAAAESAEAVSALALLAGLSVAQLL